MTGTVADAEDLVQETFLRAMERPPPDREASLRPWLVRVAMNLARDHLRRRKRRGYHGVWLPSPLESHEDERDDPAPDATSPEARYGLMESASFAFLIALEVLSPTQRAVLVLRDAFDFSSRETGEALELSEENVRITLHRARKAMAAYDARRVRVGREQRELAEQTLSRLVLSLARGDLAGARALFAPDARALSDGGGVMFAARRPVVGPERIVKLYGKLVSNASSDVRTEVRTVNGTAGIVGEDPKAPSPNAPRFVMLVDLDDEGRIVTLYSVLAPHKLSHVTAPRP